MRDIKLQAHAEKRSLLDGEKTRVWVTAVDDRGHPVNDLSFRWYAEPLDGLGTIIHNNRMGTEATYINITESSGGVAVSYPGQCELTVTTRYKRRRHSATITIENR